MLRHGTVATVVRQVVESKARSRHLRLPAGFAEEVALEAASVISGALGDDEGQVG